MTSVLERTEDISEALGTLRTNLQAIGAWSYMAPHVRNIEHYVKLIRKDQATDEDIWDFTLAAQELSDTLVEDYGDDADFDIPNVEAEAISLAALVSQFANMIQVEVV